MADNVLLQKNTFVSSLLTLTSGQLRLNKKTLQVNDSSITAITRVSGMLISEDSLSKLNWVSNSTTGSRIIPWGSGAVAAPSYIPDTFNITTAGVSGGVNMGTLTLYTYLAPANVPAPPTVTQMNSINYPLTCGITNASINATTASTATLCPGVIVSGVGITAVPPTRVASITGATTFTLTQVATATNAAAALTLGGCNSNDIPSAVDRFWGIAKDGTINGLSVPAAATDISLSYETGLRPASFSSTSGVATPAGSVQGKGFPWRSTPTYYCSITSGSTTVSNFGSTATMFVGMSIVGPGDSIGSDSGKYRIKYLHHD